MIRYTDDAGERGYTSGYTYRVGGRPPLDTDEQVAFAVDLAVGICTTPEQVKAFITRFQKGYSDREVVQSLISGAARAEEVFSLDGLEEYADEQRKEH